MTPPTPALDLLVLARREPTEVTAYLRDVGETDLASRLEAALGEAKAPRINYGGLLSWWPFRDRQPPIWLSASHAFGYLAPAPPGEQPLPIRYAGTAIAPDPALRQRARQHQARPAARQGLPRRWHAPGPPRIQRP